MAFISYVRFMDDDRDYSACTFVWKPEEGYERHFSISPGRSISFGEREILVDFLQSRGIIADMDEYSGEIHILPDRKPEKKE